MGNRGDRRRPLVPVSAGITRYPRLHTSGGAGVVTAPILAPFLCVEPGGPPAWSLPRIGC